MRTIDNILAQISRFCARKGDIHEFGTKSGHIPRPPPLTFARGVNIIFVYFLRLPARNIKMPVRFARLCLFLLCKSKKLAATPHLAIPTERDNSPSCHFDQASGSERAEKSIVKAIKSVIVRRCAPRCFGCAQHDNVLEPTGQENLIFINQENLCGSF